MAGGLAGPVPFKARTRSRVKTTITTKDTINLDTLSSGFAINRPVTRQYKWLSPGIRVPVLGIRTVALLGAEVATEIFFYDQPHTITVQQPLVDLLCTGAPVVMPYDRTGTYNSGALFNPANVFRTQLSDVNGDFTNAVNIGSVTSTVPGNINATLPANKPPSTGYRIRVVSTSPALTGTDNGYDLTIRTAPVALATANGPHHLLCGGTVQFLVEEPPASATNGSWTAIPLPVRTRPRWTPLPPAAIPCSMAILAEAIFPLQWTWW